ncbi:MAG: hypothetical protein P3W87_001720 [Gammaproteobacteria bacterium]|nr:hypothetical protein [Gammaproteobacteria bacterium]
MPMYAVMVKPSERRKVCRNASEIWVKSRDSMYYVSEEERGLWPSRQEAEKAIVEASWEVVVPVDAAPRKPKFKPQAAFTPEGEVRP